MEGEYHLGWILMLKTDGFLLTIRCGLPWWVGTTWCVYSCKGVVSPGGVFLEEKTDRFLLMDQIE